MRFESASARSISQPQRSETTDAGDSTKTTVSACWSRFCKAGLPILAAADIMTVQERIKPRRFEAGQQLLRERVAVAAGVGDEDPQAAIGLAHLVELTSERLLYSV